MEEEKKLIGKSLIECCIICIMYILYMFGHVQTLISAKWVYHNITDKYVFFAVWALVTSHKNEKLIMNQIHSHANITHIQKECVPLPVHSTQMVVLERRNRCEPRFDDLIYSSICFAKERLWLEGKKPHSYSF